MKRVYIRKYKKTNECDTCVTDGGFDYSGLGFGMGPVNPLGGPDRFDNFVIKKPKRKKRSVKKWIIPFIQDIIVMIFLIGLL